MARESQAGRYSVHWYHANITFRVCKWRGEGIRGSSVVLFFCFFTFKEQKSKPSASAYPSPGLEKGQKPSASENQALTVLNKHLKCHWNKKPLQPTPDDAREVPKEGSCRTPCREGTHIPSPQEHQDCRCSPPSGTWLPRTDCTR